MSYDLTVLPSGLTAVTIPMPGRRSVSVGIWVRTGSRYEPRRISGISHCIEHMLFKGTKKRTSRQIKEEIEGTGGYLNAFTSEESTCYFAKTLVPHLAGSAEVLADMVQNAVMDGGELEKEKTVIVEEIKMYQDQPAHRVQDLISELLWPDHPLGMPISGTAETVSSFDRPGLLSYKKRYYYPHNLILAISGPVSHDETVRLAKRCFHSHAPKREHVPRPAPAYRQKAPKFLFLNKQAEQTHFAIGVHGFSRYHRDRYVLVLLNMILGGNMSSRLFEEIREKRGLAYEIKSQAAFYRDAGAVLISGGAESAKTVRTIRLILRELTRLRTQPVKTAELRRAKDYFMNQFYMSLEDSLDYMLWAGETLIYRDKIPAPEEIRRGIEAVTPAQIQDAARRLFKIERLNLACIGPLDSRLEASVRGLIGDNPQRGRSPKRKG